MLCSAYLVTLADAVGPETAAIVLEPVLGEGGVRPLADMVTDSRIADWAHGRELVFTELQIGALRAAAAAIADMPHEHTGPQAARLCTSDPLCADHDPRDRGDLFGAACHACLFASETSCERGNHYLDRALLVDTITGGGTGFLAR